jgi:hypothetical protein
LDEQTILSSAEDFGNVSVCPGGIIHVNLTHCSLKFLPADFIRLSDMIAEARRNYGPTRPQLDGKARLTVVPTNSCDDSIGPTIPTED